jgi:Peptidase A4 family
MTGTTRRRSAVATIGAAAVVAMMGWAAPAGAAVHSGSRASGLTNPNFAGYQVAAPKKHIKTVTETFVVPSISCKKNYSGVGPSVIVASTVNKKTNTYSNSGAGVGVACVHKQPKYQSIIEVDSTFFNDQPLLSAGDRVTVTTTMGKHKVAVTLDDLTSKTTFSHSGKGATGATADLGCATLQINKHSLGLDPFGKLKVTHAEVNGKSLKAEKAAKVTWVKKKHVLVTAGKLSKGKNFTLTFKRSR